MGLSSSIRRLTVATLALAMLAGLVAAAVPARAASSEAPTLLGFATGKDWRTDLPNFAKEAGKFPAFHEVFRTIDSDWTAKWLPAFYQDPHDWGMVSWLVTYVNDLDGFNQGKYDPDLKAMVGFFKSWMSDASAKRLVLAPFPEANLAGHPWGGDPAGYKAAFKRIHDAFRKAGLGPKRVRFAFVMNGISSAGLSYDQFYPGDDLVDILSFNKHNRNIKLSSDPAWRDYEATFGMHIEEMQRLISRTKPIFINQTGSVEDPDDPNRREQWIDDMFAGLKANDQVIGAAYLNRVKQESTGTYDFRVLVDGKLDSHFAAGYATWSGPDAAAWIFDGRMDDWVANRAATLDTGFLDVPSNHVFADAIRWLGASGITQGCNPPANDLFCPDDPLTRGQMAAMLARGLNLPATSSDYFDDDDASVFEGDINRLAAAEITLGCNPPANDLYCPDANLTRAQMAAFMVRAFGYPSAGNVDPFRDDDGSVFEGDIEALAAAGITLGCNPPTNDRFCPDDPITRGQMAAFLYRAYH